jgi:hypothetical protein
MGFDRLVRVTIDAVLREDGTVDYPKCELQCQKQFPALFRQFIAQLSDDELIENMMIVDVCED